MIPEHWQRALDARKAHFRYTRWDTLRLLHGEDAHIRCDRLGPVCWFYCYRLPTPEHLAAMAGFAEAAQSPHWCAQFMQDRGRDPRSRWQHPSSAPEAWTANEGDLSYHFRRAQGLSPGLFLDQRANRRWLRAHAVGCRVLNLFSYTGGFSLNAVQGGASQVTSVDLSRAFLDWSRANFTLNQMEVEAHEFWSTDARYFLRGCAKRGRRFDLIVCDPPSFARGPQGVFSLEKDLTDLLRQIDDALERGGLLLLSSNYEKWNQRTFVEQVRQVLREERYEAVDLPALDIDVAADDAAHRLKALALRKA